MEEHRLLRVTFARIEASLPGARRVATVQGLAAEVEAALKPHARTEEDLVLLTLEHLPQHQVWCRTFHRQHQEIDGSLTLALASTELASAKRLLKQALQYSRHHFTYEERKVFPFLTKWIDRNLLEKLERIWEHRQGVGLD